MARNAWFGLALLAAAAAAVGACSEEAVEAKSSTPPAESAVGRTSLAATAGVSTTASDTVVPGSRAAGQAADSVTQADAEAALADSVQKAREIEVMRETFAYVGGTRDPFASLIDTDKVGPEIADLDLVGVYLDLRTPSNNVVVLREKTTSKRHKMRVGDQLGRARLTQIRPRDAVFTVQDFGFERQETLSLRKQEVETP